MDNYLGYTTITLDEFENYINIETKLNIYRDWDWTFSELFIFFFDHEPLIGVLKDYLYNTHK